MYSLDRMMGQPRAGLDNDQASMAHSYTTVNQHTNVVGCLGSVFWHLILGTEEYEERH
jgi:hypothetical protein